MPRPRKYDYKENYPVKIKLYLKLPVKTTNELEKMGYTYDDLSEIVEKFLVDFAEKNRKKD